MCWYGGRREEVVWATLQVGKGGRKGCKSESLSITPSPDRLKERDGAASYPSQQGLDGMVLSMPYRASLGTI